MRVMVIENDAAAAEHLSFFADQCGLSVAACVGTAAEALRVASSTPLDLIIADVDLGPEGDGIAVAVTVAETFGLKTVFITGHTEARTRDRAQEAWPFAFLVKPVSFETFQRIMKAASDSIGPSQRQRAMLHWQQLSVAAA